MKKNIKKILRVAMIVPAFALCLGVFAPAQQVFAVDPVVTGYGGIGAGLEAAKPENDRGLFEEGGYFTIIINTALFLIGAISVVMLIYGGIRYTISAGNTEGVTNAKNTILYAIVGIIIALLAYAIVQFVIGQLSPT